jgi:LmbE family N-acetylglucosaminyl deacetylase
MSSRRRLMAVLAHPDDESLGVGGTLAKYAAEGVEVFLVTATRGEGGRFRNHRCGDARHPGPLALGNIRETELRAAATVLGVREVSLLDYHDQHLDRADPRELLPGLESTWAAYQAAVGTLAAIVDGVERHATPWPDWAITTVIDTSAMWRTVWRAVSCHESQLAAYERLRDLSPEHHRTLWGGQSFYRAFSIVNGGRAQETDLFEGVGR